MSRPTFSIPFARCLVASEEADFLWDNQNKREQSVFPKNLIANFMHFKPETFGRLKIRDAIHVTDLIISNGKTYIRETF